MSKNPELHPSLQSVFSVLKGKMHASEIADHLRIMPSVAHNRLRKLMLLDRVDRTHINSGWVYFRKAAK